MRRLLQQQFDHVKREVDDLEPLIDLTIEENDSLRESYHEVARALLIIEKYVPIDFEKIGWQHQRELVKNAINEASASTSICTCDAGDHEDGPHHAETCDFYFPF